MRLSEFLNEAKLYSINGLGSYVDMGLCGDVSNINQSNIYGVIPYVAPEVLKGELYTQAADVYSFGIKKEQQHYEIGKQFKEAEEYRKSQLAPFDENKRLVTHPQAIYTSRLLNPFTDNIDNNTVEIIDFTKL
ncbi:unnamed protein product [Rhizophagus irregularis]|nr:unnamed protein product [Rhizophagus irregularis]